MSQIKHKHQLLAAIDHLRERKARPDINRICSFMLKCHQVSPSVTKAELRRCLKEKIIYKVDYKNNVSYRNASKLRKQRSSNNRNNNMAASVATSERRIITSAIATLIYQDQSFLENGIAFEELVKAAASQESKYSKKQLETIIRKELASGSLVKLPNRNLALGPADGHDGDSSDSFKFEHNVDSNTKMTSSANSSTRSSPQRTRGRPRKKPGAPSSNNSATSTRNAAVRVGERRKMAKKVFDPSDLNVPSKRKRGRPVGSLNKSTTNNKKQVLRSNQSKSEKDDISDGQSEVSCDDIDMEQEEPSPHETSGVCSVCLVQKPRGSNDRLVECRDCSNKAHLSCLQSGSGILKPRPDNTWQCPHCKTCVVCCETNDALDVWYQCMEVKNFFQDAWMKLVQGGSPVCPDDEYIGLPYLSLQGSLVSLIKILNFEEADQGTLQAEGILTVCSICSDAYHALCHSPRIPERLKAWDQWECNNCLESRPTILGSPAIIRNNIGNGHHEEDKDTKEEKDSTVYPFLKPHEIDRAPSKLKEEMPEDKNIPDITDWSSDDVYEYFKEHHPEGAPILKEQDFDGQALSMARRADIVRGLGLPLGPALSLYRIVVKLQTRKDDWTMCWG